jgi:hypothetical protein
MSVLSHLSLTMVPLMVGVMFSQTEALRKVWHWKPKRTSKARVGAADAARGVSSYVESQASTSE